MLFNYILKKTIITPPDSDDDTVTLGVVVAKDTPYTTANLDGREDFKQLIQKEYNEIYNNMKKNHGFYIGIYGTGNLSKEKVVSKKSNEDKKQYVS